VPEAAAVLRISRGSAYELARLWLATGGGAGLPVILLGRRLRVPKIALERLLAGEPQPISHLRPVGEPNWAEAARRSG
jgi:hypothetical protein